MTLEERFGDAKRTAATLDPKRLGSVLLKVGGLARQVELGDAPEEKSDGHAELGHAEFDAWAVRRGMKKDQAMEMYCALVENLALA